MRVTGMKVKAVRQPLAVRFQLWIKCQRLARLRRESLEEWAELDRTRARIQAIDSAIIRAANEIATLQLSK